MLHTTGSAAPALDGVAAVVFWLADPLRELYPDCFAEASHLAAEAEKRGIRVVNRPESLSNTIKSKQSELWQAAGIPCAPVATFGSLAELSLRLATATFPSSCGPISSTASSRPSSARRPARPRREPPRPA